MTAAENGDVPILDYVQDCEPASAAQLTEMLNTAASHHHLAAAQWLRQQGAEWPAVLQFGRESWDTGVLQWARDEGCTSLTTDTTIDTTTAGTTAATASTTPQLASDYSQVRFTTFDSNKSRSITVVSIVEYHSNG
jgi:hypothetical protein